ncbi:hypothetical protein Q7P37_009773 [Cladosporium fusiforme]
MTKGKSAASREHPSTATNRSTSIHPHGKRTLDKRLEQPSGDPANKRIKPSYKAGTVAVTNALKVEPEDSAEWSVPSSEIAKEGQYASDLKFAFELQKKAVPSRTSDANAKFLLEHRAKRKNDLIPEILSFTRSPIYYDVDRVTSNDQLRQALERKFKLIHGKGSHGLFEPGAYDIKQQIHDMGSGGCDAYQPNKAAKDGSYTQQVTTETLRRIFVEKTDSPSEYGLNCLNLPNRSSRTFRNVLINDVDLNRQIDLKTFDGNVSRETNFQEEKEWMLLTKKPSVSHFHVDSGGYCTAVMVIEGKKHWLVPSGPLTSAMSEFSSLGPWNLNYGDPISCMTLEPGDLMIQAPGTPHAVVTTDDSLVVGFFFYTAAHFANTIQCIRQRLKGRLYSNDDEKNEDYKKLSSIMENIDMDGLFTREQKSDVCTEIGVLLEQEKLVYYDKKTSSLKHKARGAGNRAGEVSEVEDSKREFLDRCLKWWIKRRAPDHQE